jgi:prepilin-type processing-associated H-X9-DG protein/prepilin-type N-terminal cleavage/methylation domain-containing protein
MIVVSQRLESSGIRFSKDWKTGARGFSLMELLVVVATIAVLAAVLLPALGSGRGCAERARCTSNLRQLHAANAAYADDRGAYVAAAPDIRATNRQRWHGTRASSDQPFRAADSPLEPFLGASGRIRMCGAFRPETAGFESGCGGYGYNAAGVGSQAYLHGADAGAGRGMAPEAIRDPVGTLMFADTAFPSRREGRSVLIEYSFAEPYRHLADARPEETYVADPSIHFRHAGRAGVVWCDGHVSAEAMVTRKATGGFSAAGIGWPGGPDNARFDPF